MRGALLGGVAAGALGCASAGGNGWTIIAEKIGGSPLGVAFFEDGMTGITATSQIVPAGYEVKRSMDGGVTWATVPDDDLFVFGLYNSAVAGSSAVVSGDEFIQVSLTKAANFTAAPNSLSDAGGQIVRKLQAADGSFYGFAIMGMTDDGNTNGFVSSTAIEQAWTENNVDALGTQIAIDGSFLNASWVIVGNTYETSAKEYPVRTRKWRREGGQRRLVATPASELQGATYETNVVASTDAGASWRTVYQNNSIAALGVACIDAAHCCFVGEDATYSYAVCTTDGWKSTHTFLDETQGAALVEVAVAPGACPAGSPAKDAYIAVGGAVGEAGQVPAWFRSCDYGLTWAPDAAANMPVADLLVTDVDCQPHTPNGTACWTTLWDNDGIDPNGYVARYFA